MSDPLSAPPGPWWRRHGHVLLPLLAGLLVYLPSLRGGFLYDDMRLVVANRGIRDLWALGTVLRSDPTRPLLALTLALNHAASGLTPWPYHLVNVLLHAANAALVGGLLLWMARRAGAPRPQRAALLGGCFFAVTPMAVETVAYVASRSSALASLLGLAALLTVVPALTRPAPWRVGAGLLLAAVALLAKEEAASLPLLLVLLDLCFVSGLDPRGPWSRRRLHLPFLLMPVVGLGLRWAVTGLLLPAPMSPSGRYLLSQAAAFPGYVLRAVFPVDPAFYRGVDLSPWPPDLDTAGRLVLAAAVVAVAVWARRRAPQWTFAVAWMALALVPSSTLLALKEVVVDHRAYLGGVGVAYAVGLLFAREGLLPFAVTVLALLSAGAVRYQWVLADPVRAWEDAVGRAPQSAEAHWALGQALDERKDPRAEAMLKTAVGLAMDDPRALANLAAYYMDHGHLPEAEVLTRQAVRLAPGDGRLHDNLGLVLLAQGRLAEARKSFEAAIAASPQLAQPRINLASVLAQQGDKAQARAVLEEAARLEIDPQDAAVIQALRDRLLP